MRNKLGPDGGVKKKTSLTVKSLIAAAGKGDLRKIKMCIAQGLNPNAISGGIAPDCALGRAAEKGQLETVKLLLLAGADPNNPLLPQHLSHPLDCAVLRHNIPCATELLNAGANANRRHYDGGTALDIARIYSDSPMMKLLKQYGAKTGGELGGPTVARIPFVESYDEHVVTTADFSHETSTPRFSKFLKAIANDLDTEAIAMPNVKGGFSFSLPSISPEKHFDKYFEEVQKNGFLLFRNKPSVSDGFQKLVLLPISDKYKAIEAMQTCGHNYDIAPSDIVHWLQNLEKRQPFVLTGIGGDFLEGMFTTDIKDVKTLAQEIYDFCPDVVTQGTETVQKLATELRKTKSLFLWWD